MTTTCKSPKRLSRGQSDGGCGDRSTVHRLAHETKAAPKEPYRYHVRKQRLTRNLSKIIRVTHLLTNDLEEAKAKATEVGGSVRDCETGKIWTPDIPYFIPPMITVFQ